MVNEISFWEKEATEFIKDYDRDASKNSSNYPTITVPTRIKNINLEPGKMICFSFTAWSGTKYRINHVCTGTTAVTGSVVISRTYPNPAATEYGYLTSYEPTYMNSVDIQLDTTDTIYFIAKVPSKYSEALTFGWSGYIEVYEVPKEEPPPPQQQQQQIQQDSTDISGMLLSFKNDILDRISNVANEILYRIENVGSVIQSTISALIDFLSEKISMIYSIISEVITSIISEVYQAFTSVVSTLIDTISTIVSGIQMFIKQVVDTVISYINTLIDTINEMLVQPLLALFTDIVNEIRNLPERVADAIASIIFEEVEVSE